MRAPRRLRVLSVSGIFPNPSEPGCGPFTRAHLTGLAERADVTVIAPVAPFDYDNPRRRGLGRRSVPVRRRDGKLDVLHPAWIYFPGNGAANGICLALSLIPLVYRLRRRFPFDVIDAHFAHPEGVAGWLLARLFGCPYVIRLNGNELVHRRLRFRRMLMARALRGASRVIAVSDELKALAISLGAEASKVRVIPNGVDASVFHPRRREPARRRTILTAGRLIEAKGHHHIISALRILRDQGVDAELIIAGGASRGLPNDENRLKRLIVRQGLDGFVRLLGWVPPRQLAELMSAADVFCLASLREGCPNVVIEALACGVPVVGTDVGMMRKLVPEHCGVVVPPGDPAALAAALRRAFEQQWDRDSISRTGRARSWGEAAGEAWEQLRDAAANAQSSDGNA